MGDDYPELPPSDSEAEEDELRGGLLSPSSSSGASSSGGAGRRGRAAAAAQAAGPLMATARWAMSVLTLRFAEPKLERRFQRWRNVRLARVSAWRMGCCREWQGTPATAPVPPPTTNLTPASACLRRPCSHPCVQMDATALLCLLLYYIASCLLPPFSTCLPWPGTGLLPALTAAAPLLLLLLDRSHHWFSQHRCAQCSTEAGLRARARPGSCSCARCCWPARLVASTPGSPATPCPARSQGPATGLHVCAAGLPPHPGHASLSVGGAARHLAHAGGARGGRVVRGARRHPAGPVCGPAADAVGRHGAANAAAASLRGASGARRRHRRQPGRLRAGSGRPEQVRVLLRQGRVGLFARLPPPLAASLARCCSRCCQLPHLLPAALPPHRAALSPPPCCPVPTAGRCC